MTNQVTLPQRRLLNIKSDDAEQRHEIWNSMFDQPGELPSLLIPFTHLRGITAQHLK